MSYKHSGNDHKVAMDLTSTGITMSTLVSMLQTCLNSDMYRRTDPLLPTY